MNVRLILKIFEEILDEKYKKLNYANEKEISEFIGFCHKIEKSFGEIYNYEVLLLLSKYLSVLDNENNKSIFMERLILFDILYSLQSDLGFSQQTHIYIPDKTITIANENFTFIDKLNITNKNIKKIIYLYSDNQDVRITNFIKNNNISEFNAKCNQIKFYDKYTNKNGNDYIDLTQFIKNIGTYNPIKVFEFKNFKCVDIFTLLMNFPNLETLELTGSLLNDNAGKITFDKNDDHTLFLNLKHIYLLNFGNALKNNSYIDIIKICPNLESISIRFGMIDDSFVMAMIDSCKHITSISIPNCRNISLNILYRIVDSYPNLEYLDISNNEINEDFLIYALKNLKQIKQINTGNTGFLHTDKNNNLKITIASMQKYFKLINEVGMNSVATNEATNEATNRISNKFNIKLNIELNKFMNSNLNDTDFNNFLINIDKQSMIISKTKNIFKSWFGTVFLL